MIMKMFKFLVLISFFLAFTTTFVHAEDPDLVTDVNGNRLNAGDRYYIAAPFAAAGPSKPNCPFGNVVLDSGKRRPISITPVLKSNSTAILEDTYVTVRFNYLYPCRALFSVVWTIGPGSKVTTGGIEGLSRFKITKYEGEEGGSNNYQLSACPVFDCLGVCRCEPVGYHVKEDGVTYQLVAGGQPTPIVFLPAIWESSYL